MTEQKTNLIQQALEPTICNASHQSLPDRYVKGQPLTAAMVTPQYIRAATNGIRTADDSVAVNRYKGVIPTIEQCVSQLGVEKTVAAIKAQLVLLNVITNSSRPMSEAVIDAIAPILLDFIMSLEVSINMADFRIVFDRAARGDYGKIYGAIGCQDVCSWFRSYEREKMDAIDRYEEAIKQGDLCGPRCNSSEFASLRQAMHDAQVHYQTEKAKGGAR